MSLPAPVRALRFADPPRFIANEGAPRLPAHLPPHADGMRIGLFGGTFNPPHAGHLLVSRIALSRMKLDRVWWIVTPGNPLKENAGLPPLASRMAAARAVADHPRIDITGFEAEIGTRYTYDTVEYLARRCPGVDFVWMMGADNLAQFSQMAALARDRRVDAHRGHRPSGLDAQGGAQSRRPVSVPLSPPRRRGRPAAGDRDPGVSFPARSAFGPVLDGAAPQGRRPPNGAGTCRIVTIGRSRARTTADRSGFAPPSRRLNFTGFAPTLKMRRAPRGPTGDMALIPTVQARAAQASPEPVRVQAEPDTGQLVRNILDSLDDAKAEDVLFHRPQREDFARRRDDHRDRPLHDACLGHRRPCDQGCKEAGYSAPRVEGLPHCDWVLVDAGDVIVHVFRPEVRQFYNLEKMWGGDRPAEQKAEKRA